jgi:iron complex outermembrane receptor protein
MHRLVFALALPGLLLPAPGAAVEEAPDDHGEEEETEVLITAPRPAGRDSSAAMDRVDGDRLRQSPRASALEALAQETAGLYVTNRGSALHGVAAGASGGMAVRGLGGSPNTQVLVVEDGVPDIQGIFGHPIPDAYAAALLEEAVLVKGGDSVLFGTNAMGGAILLESRWLGREGLELRHDLAYGSFGTLRASATALARAGDWDLAAAFQTVHGQGFRPGAGGGLELGQLKVRHHLGPDLSLSLRAKVVHLAGADPGPLSHPHAGHTFEAWREVLSLELRRPASDRAFGFRVLPYLQTGQHRLYDGFRSLDLTAGALAELVSRPLARLAFLWGMQVEGVHGRVENRLRGERLPVEDGFELAAYGQASLQAPAGLELTLGARGLHHSAAGSLGLWKAGLVWRSPWGLEVRTRVAENYRRPTLRELYLPFPTANPELRPERALTWDAGAGFTSHRLELSLGVYRTAAEDLIKYFGAWPTAEVVNIDRLVIWGLEGQARLKSLGPLSAYASVAWQEVGRFTRQNPSLKLNAGLSLWQAFGAHHLLASLDAEWVHGLYMANHGRQPLPDVLLLMWSVGYRFVDPGRGLVLSPYLRLDNLLDRRQAFIQDYPLPGFSALAGLAVEY